MILKIEHLPNSILKNTIKENDQFTILHKIEIALSKPYAEEGVPFEELIMSLEKDLINKAMKEVNENQSKAARLLRLKRDKLRYRLKNFDLEN